MTTWLFEPGVDGTAPSDVLDITLRFQGDVTVCVLEGPLCASTAPTLDSWLGQLQECGRDRVVVDAADVDTISSDGVEVLAAHAARFERAGGALQIRSASEGARRAFELCGADHLLEESGS